MSGNSEFDSLKPPQEVSLENDLSLKPPQVEEAGIPEEDDFSVKPPQ